jgi:hypothetical protein
VMIESTMMVWLGWSAGENNSIVLKWISYVR